MLHYDEIWHGRRMLSKAWLFLYLGKQVYLLEWEHENVLDGVADDEQGHVYSAFSGTIAKL